MGTLAASDVIVHLKDSTDNVVLDSDTISFSGLGTTPYVTDDVEVTFTWDTDSDDIGVHLLKVFAEPVTSEPDTEDNMTTVVFDITPRDYATTELNNPWDMSEATTMPIPIWNTKDITSMTGWNTTLYTDSITGMFEGGMADPSDPNKMVLNTGTGSSDWIDADEYVNFSIAGKASHNISIHLYWVDPRGTRRYIDTGVNLTSSWKETTPVDLSAIAGSEWGGSIDELWIEFDGSNLPTDVRIGWIKLTE